MRLVPVKHPISSPCWNKTEEVILHVATIAEACGSCILQQLVGQFQARVPLLVTLAERHLLKDYSKCYCPEHIASSPVDSTNSTFEDAQLWSRAPWF